MDLFEYLKNNEYPGRGILVGRYDEEDVIAYFIMGRSANSRNRLFRKKDDILYTKAYDESKVEVSVNADGNIVISATGENAADFINNLNNERAYICVNGHALKDIKSNNTNFAFISKVNLTQPVTNTRLYGESIARIANVLGDGKPIIQSLKDLRNGRRSEWHRINKGFIEPTLKDCVAGDLALVMPHRIITNIIEGLEILDKIIPGVNNDDTLLYGPEIKFFSNEIETDKKFRLKDDNIYFVGDGAGKAGNIVTAAATGLVAARDILERM